MNYQQTGSESETGGIQTVLQIVRGVVENEFRTKVQIRLIYVN